MKHPIRKTLALSAVMVAASMAWGQDPASPPDAGSTPILVDEPVYPRLLESSEGRLVVHVPQIDSWEKFERIEGWTVVEATPTGSETARLGGVRFAAESDIDLSERLVMLHHIAILQISFPDAPEEEEERLGALMRSTLSTQPRAVPLDVLLFALPGSIQVRLQGGLGFNPPVIFASTAPAALIFIDGEPVLAPIEGTDLQFVVNTNWDVFFHGKEPRWYLLNGSTWMQATSLEGEWERVTDLPAGFERLPDDDNWKAVRGHLPPGTQEETPPRIQVSKKPAELILLDGEPAFEEIPGTTLQMVVNTESDLFRQKDTYYYLVSGRWFQAAKLDGPWESVLELPADFAEIPPDHLKAGVRASVPGTDEAQLAVIETQIPRKARIARTAGESMQVRYDGEPRFEKIIGTSLQRAVNTAYQVILVGGTYYLCYDAVWFRSGSPSGPWTVTETLPSEIASIPPSDPAHNTTYVKVFEEDHDEESVVHGYTSGYEGLYVENTVVYGTGWNYSPYVNDDCGEFGLFDDDVDDFCYPVYWWYPRSYGYGAWYNPVIGAYGRRAAAYGPYGGVSAASFYRPRTGTYARGVTVRDSDELARRGGGYNPSSDTAFRKNRYYDFDDRGGWSSTYIRRGDDWAQIRTEVDDGTITRDIETSKGRSGEVTRERGQRQGEVRAESERQEGRGESSRAPEDRGSARRESREGAGPPQIGEDITGMVQTPEGDFYIGRNGEVYKKTDEGWFHSKGGDWENAASPDFKSGAPSRQEQAERDRDREWRPPTQRASPATPEPDLRQEPREGGQRVQRERPRSGAPRADRREFDRQELDRLQRHHEARRQGYDRYREYQRQRARSPQGGHARGRRGGGRRR